MQRPFRGIRGVELALGTLADRCRAYVPALHPDAVFSHSTAARLLALPLPRRLQDEEAIHVTCGSPTRPRIPGVSGHRERNLRTIRWQDLPLAAPADVWCQLAMSLAAPELIALGDALISMRRSGGGLRAPWCSAEDLEAAVERRSPAAGTAKLRAALPKVRADVDSPKETELRLLLLERGFPEPVLGARARDARGEPVRADGFPVRPDLSYPEARVALEYEGDQHRTDPRQWRIDLARVRALEAAGWIVIRVTAADLRSPQDLLRDLSAALARRA